MGKKIAITGPESTGKSTIAKELAIIYKTAYVPEYARVYLDKNGLKYSADDIETIARKQIELEDALDVCNHDYLFCDTDLIVLKIWYEHFFGNAPEWLNKAVKERKYDLYFLMDIDLEWEADPMREHPEKRQYFFELFKNTLDSIQANYVVISGKGEERTRAAVHAIDSM